MTKEYWTARGIDRLDTDIRTLELKVQQYSRIRLENSLDRNVESKDLVAENKASESERQMDLARLVYLQKMRSVAYPAPPADGSRAQTGTPVTIKHLNDTCSCKEGCVKTVILGGYDESDHTSNPRTVSRNSALGQALMGTKVGDEIEFIADNGTIFEAEIIQIDASVPDELVAVAA